MTTYTDRQILDQGLAAYTAKGWRIVSQSDSSFQVAEPKKLNPIGMALFVMLPGVLSCVAFLIAPVYGLLLGLVALIGLALVALDYAVKHPTIHYVTADQLRARPPQSAR